MEEKPKKQPEDFKIIGPSEEEIAAANSQKYAPKGLGKAIRAIASNQPLRIVIAIAFTAFGLVLTYQRVFR